MQAVIMMGGLGTRLGSAAQGLPKAMVPVLGKPFLEYLINFLKKHGIFNYVFCVGYLPNVIEDYFGDGKNFGVEIIYSKEEVPLYSAGALKQAENFLEEDFILVNGDTYHDIDYKNIFDFHKENNAFITIASHNASEENKNFHRFLEWNGKVKRYYGRKEHIYSNAAATGIFVINKKILENIQKGVAISVENDLIDNFAKEGKVFTVISNRYYKDIGTPEEYQEFIEDVRNNNLS